jgi:hypothetical protein
MNYTNVHYVGECEVATRSVLAGNSGREDRNVHNMWRVPLSELMPHRHILANRHRPCRNF